MSSLTADLAALLQQVRRPGDFYAAGTAEIHTPRLEVEGVGPIALPLLPVQAEQILAVAEQAPYGRGTETLVDTEVRRTWQVDAARVHIGGRRWGEELALILRRVHEGLGVTGEVSAELYKLLIYDAGGFFVSHRDTEKAAGMFATLVVVLPSEHTGGELIIRHRGREVRLDLHPGDPCEVAFAAFYADCRHEVLPVASGYRLALIYNLLRRGRGPLPEAPDYARQQGEVSALLRAWATLAEDTGAPCKLVYPLEHAYTEAELAFDTLKGADAAVAGVLAAAARSADCDLHLALLSIEESGWAEYGDSRWGEVEYEIGEVTQSSQTLHDWRGADGGRPAMAALPFTDEEVCPPDALADAKETEPEFEEATGNEGVSFERFYQRAALVLWPRAHRPRVVAGGGLGLSLPFLSELVQRWEDGGHEPADPIRDEAMRLADYIRQGWPERDWERRHATEQGHVRAFLDGLARLGDLEQRTAFVADQVAAGAYGAADNRTILDLLRQLPTGRAGELLTAVIANNGRQQADTCACLLRLASEPPSLPAEALRPAARALVGVLPDGQTADEPYWTVRSLSRHAPTSALVADSLIALERIDPRLASEALEKILSLPAVYPMDELLVPAALGLRNARPSIEPASIGALRRRVLDHLEPRIQEPLEPPADWRRPAEVACTCTYCADLNRFLAAEDMPEWRLKAAERARQHVQSMVVRHRCDLDLSLDTRGRPYTLLCTKNQASYNRRLQQRQQDLEHRAQLAD